MTTDPNSTNSNSAANPTPPSASSGDRPEATTIQETEAAASNGGLSQPSSDVASTDPETPETDPVPSQVTASGPPPSPVTLPDLIRVIAQRSPTVLIWSGLAIMAVGLSFNSIWLSLLGSVLALLVSLRLIWPSYQLLIAELSPRQRSLIVAIPAFGVAVWGLMQAIGINRLILRWGDTLRWDVIGAIGDFVGAFGQILIAVLAVYVAWRQYVIARDLTTQQNLITQQQTIDAYFQGISDLVLDEEGLLEDWPQERAIAEGRTAAILSSIDAAGKAKVVRFLSQSRLLTPLQRDRRLGRPILDGVGGYAEDRAYGIRVIDLGVMLAAADLSGTDLRWTDLSEANLVRANLSECDLVRANLARTILYDANLAGADMMGTRLFYGEVEHASPRSRSEDPNYQTGEYTGAVVEGANFTEVQRMSEAQRYYCCAWGGSKTRGTIPGGCDGIPNKLGR